MSRLALVEAYDEAWRTFSWSGAVSLMRCKTCWTWHQGTTARRWYSPLYLMHIYSRALPCRVLVRALSTGQPHSLSAGGGVLRLEASQYPSTGNRNHEICCEFLRKNTSRSDKLDDRLVIWKWKTGIPSCKHGMSPPQISIGRTQLICERLTAQPVRVGSWFDPVFLFLNDRHLVIPSASS